MNRYEAITLERRNRQQKRLAAAADALRITAKSFGVDVRFAGSFARGCVAPNSDLDVLVYESHCTDAFLSEVERLSILHDVEVDIWTVRDDQHPSIETIQ